MIRGLVIGKFLPIHEGHIALIRFAASQCDELIVSMSYTNADVIDHTTRLDWIRVIFKTSPNITVASVEDNFDDESLSLAVRTPIWADIVHKKYGAIDILFSSEEYGDAFAKNLGAKHVAFDPDRNKYPVSASLIRKYPFQYWSFIPGVVKPYFVKKICFYGPESTGKSTMAIKMAEHFNTLFVPEVARELITSNEFTVEDIIRIGHAQTDRIREKVKSANKILFCDTDVITTEIYSNHYLGVIPPILFDLEKVVKYDYYFLFNTDTPWVADHMRDLGEKRLEMYTIFKEALDERNIPYIVVQGNYEEREKFVRDELDKVISTFTNS